MDKNKEKKDNTILKKEGNKSNFRGKKNDNKSEVDLQLNRIREKAKKIYLGRLGSAIKASDNDMKIDIQKKLNELGIYVYESDQVKHFIDHGQINSLNQKISHFKTLEINENSIIAKVLINKEQRSFQKRRFDLEPFAEMNLKVNDIVEIRITTSPGKRLFSYTKIEDDSEIKTIFKKKDHFKDLENSSFFKPLPIENEDHF